MANISKEEYWVLNGLNDGWKWIAKDKNTDLWVYEKKPSKYADCWDEYRGVCEVVVESDLFQFIQWEDEEPYNIQELLEEYEKEGEETEVKKDKKWLVDKLTKERNETNVHDPAYQYLSEFIEEVNQLEEPEVLSSDWIKDNQLMWTSIYGSEYYVPSNKLYGKIVPKKVDIGVPEWFAEWFEGRGHEMSLYGIFNDLYTNSKTKMEEWSNQYEMGHAELQNDIASIKLHGKGIYEVEEEPKYNVKIESSFGTVGIYLFKQGDEVLAGDNFKAYRPKEDEFRLTEHEIRSFQNGDILFEHFAVKVEEIEE